MGHLTVYKTGNIAGICPGGWAVLELTGTLAVMLDLSTDRANAAENVLGKNQRFRIFQNGVGDHFNVIHSLVMLMFPAEVISRCSDYTFGHALDSCWLDFVS